MPLTRRRFLITSASALALLASPLHAQIASRFDFAQWVQWTQITGMEFGLRTAYSLRSDPAAQTITVLEWHVIPTQAIRLWTVPDTENFMAKRLFDIYDRREEEQTAMSYQIIEDFTWMETGRLHEKIWTSSIESSNDIWAYLTNKDNGTPIDMPEEGVLIWLQPTRDTISQDESQNILDLNGSTENHPLHAILTAMIADDLFVSAIPNTTVATLLQGTVLTETEKSSLVILPSSLPKPYTSVYVRLMPINNNPDIVEE